MGSGVGSVNPNRAPVAPSNVQGPASPAAPARSADSGSGAVAQQDQTAFTQARGAAAPQAGANLSVPDTLQRAQAGGVANAQQAAPASPTAPLSVTDPAEREKLIGASSQVNPLSQAAGNSQSICAGAAMTNALLMDCKTPEDCKRNAAALTKMAEKTGAFNDLPPGVQVEDVQKALDNLEKGKLSPTDAQNLQQLMYTVARKVQGGEHPALINSAGMASTVAMMHKAGAFKDSSPTFHESRLADGGNHWTCTVDGKHANSLPPGVREGTPSGMSLDGKNPTWRAEVKLDNGPPARMHTAWRQTEENGKLKPTRDGYAYSTSFDPDKFDPKQAKQTFQNAEVSRVDRVNPGVVKDAKDEFAKRVKDGGPDAGAAYLKTVSPAQLLKDVVRDLAEGHSPALEKCLKGLSDQDFDRLNRTMQQRIEMSGDKYTLERWKDAITRARP